MAPNNLKILAYNILKSLGDDLVKDMKILELGLCSECNNEILSLNLRPFTTLSCGHTYHKLCIENKILHNAASVCSFPGCGKTIETEVDTRRDYDSSQSSGTSTITNRGSNEEEIVIRAINQPTLSSRKRKNNSTSVNNPSKRVKKLVKNEDSRILKRLVREMSTVVSRTSDLKEREALERASKLGSGKNVFFDLYFQICNAENLEEDARFEVIINYLFFGEGLEKRLVQYNHLEEHEARKKINNEVKDQLPKEVSKAAVRKKIERARKIYDLFFRITDDKD
ncbi:hypothetical protein C1645_745516 [Glomus cerebriforme]|uniref:RING-type domain-containing protein n=1 Tax=Glomus cerebriforme TaxID=658196 RepID=A0A397S0T4_9GLOM|nr:hypothetical protein C1645_745516 [Glomus cerebriforme]